jgi:hypothetical protein
MLGHCSRGTLSASNCYGRRSKISSVRSESPARRHDRVLASGARSAQPYRCACRRKTSPSCTGSNRNRGLRRRQLW